MGWKCTPYTSPTGHHSWVAGPTIGGLLFSLWLWGIWELQLAATQYHPRWSNSAWLSEQDILIQNPKCGSYWICISLHHYKLKRLWVKLSRDGANCFDTGHYGCQVSSCFRVLRPLLSYTSWLDFLNECISMYKCNLMLTILLIQQLRICVLCIVIFNYHCVNGLTDKFPSEDYTSQGRGSLSSP